MRLEGGSIQPLQSFAAPCDPSRCIPSPSLPAGPCPSDPARSYPMHTCQSPSFLASVRLSPPYLPLLTASLLCVPLLPFHFRAIPSVSIHHCHANPLRCFAIRASAHRPIHFRPLPSERLLACHFGRGSEIRTRDLLLPKQALHQAELCPVNPANAIRAEPFLTCQSPQSCALLSTSNL